MEELGYPKELLHMNGHRSDDYSRDVSYEGIVALQGPGYYKVAEEHYRCEVPATIDGMLGGLAYVHVPETQWSCSYLKRIIPKYDMPTECCLELGSGIGRVTQSVLSHFFKRIDTVEQCAAYSAAAPNYGTKYVCSAQNFKFARDYSVVWLQWVIGHLTDADLVALLRECERHSEFVILKDNLCAEGWFYDESDGNILRNMRLFNFLVAKTSYEIVEVEAPNTWPSELYPIYAIVLKRRRNA